MIETFEYWFTKLGQGYHDIGIHKVYIDYYKVVFYHDPENLSVSEGEQPEEFEWSRLDGPSAFYREGVKLWWIKNVECARYSPGSGSRNKWKWRGELKTWATAQGIDIDNLTDEDIDLIKMIWS